MEHPILTSILRAGFMPLGWFETNDSDEIPQPARFAILIGNAGPHMFQVYERDGGGMSLDDWTSQRVTALSDHLGARPSFPFTRPYLPFQRWALRAGAGHPSPLGLNIHLVYGLWQAYRALLTFPVIFDLPPHKPVDSPCKTCADKPCLSACPVQAFSPEGYDVPRCATWLSSPADGAACMEGGCLARHACPVGRAYAYPPRQARFFMRAFQKAHRS